MAGFLVGPPWAVLCAGCSPAADAPAPQEGGVRAVRIEYLPDMNALAIRAAGYLGEHFDEFRNLASDYAKYDAEIKANVAPREVLLEVIKAFREAKFDVALAPELANTLRAEAEVAKATSAAASARIEVLRARFKARNKALRIYQETGTAFLAEAQIGALLCDDPGTGKTMQTLAAWEDNAPVLVVAPVNAIGNWRREILAWRPEFKVSTPGALSRWPEPGEVVIVAYDSMRRAVEITKVEVEGKETELTKVLLTGSPAKGTAIVADEAHRLVNKTSKRRVAWDALVEPVRAAGGKAYLLTGSPVVNKDADLWSLFEAAGALGTSLFGNRRTFGRMAREGGDEYLRRVRRGMLRRTKKEVLKELPPIQWTTIDVQIDQKTREELDDVLKRVVAAAVEKKVEDAKKENEEKPEEERLDLDAVRSAAEQDVQGAIDLAFDGKIKIPFELISRVKSLLATAKLPTALEVLDDLEGAEEERAAPGQLFEGFTCDDPVCFASAHVAPVEAVARRPGWALIRGGVTAIARTEIVAKFQAGGYRGIALAIKAAGEAITLTRSSRMLINDPEWTPAAMDQLVSRIHRMGQQGRKDETAEGAEEHGSHVQILRLVADHVLDRRIQEILDVKMGIVERVVDAAAVGVEHRAISAAVEIEATLAQATIATPQPTATSVRKAQSDAERGAAALLVQGRMPTKFLQSLADQFRSRAGLSDRQWQAAVKSVTEAFVTRPARDDNERWALAGIRHLAGQDTDRVAELNDVGFSRYTSDRGHEIADAIRARGGILTENEWRDAVRICTIHTRQVGPRPVIEDREDEEAGPRVAGAATKTPFDE